MLENAHVVEEKELSIDSVAGLQDFLLYAKEALQELEDSSKSCTSSQLCSPFLSEGKEVFTALEALVAQYTRLIDLGGYLDDEHIEFLQEHYNKLLSVHDELVSAMEYVPTADPHIEKHLYGEPEGPLHQKRAVMNITDETGIEETAVPIHTHEFNSEEIRSHLKMLKQHGESLLGEAQVLLSEFESIKTVDDFDYKEGVQVYSECEERTISLRDEIAELDAALLAPVSSRTEALLHTTEASINNFSTFLKNASTELAAYFDDEEVVLPVEKTTQPEPHKKASLEPVFKASLFAKNEHRAFIEGALSVPGNAEFLANHFSSPGAFEAYIKRNIDEREKPSKFEKVFGITHKSAFDTLLCDLTLSEVEHLEGLPSDEIRQILAELDIQYETYVTWMNAYDVMKEYAQPLPDITFGEFYIRAIIEDLKNRNN